MTGAGLPLFRNRCDVSRRPRQEPAIALTLSASADKFLPRRATCRALAPIVGACGTDKHSPASRTLAIHQARAFCSVRNVEIPVCRVAPNAVGDGPCSLLRFHCTSTPSNKVHFTRYPSRYPRGGFRSVAPLRPSTHDATLSHIRLYTPQRGGVSR